MMQLLQKMGAHFYTVACKTKFSLSFLMKKEDDSKKFAVHELCEILQNNKTMPHGFLLIVLLYHKICDRSFSSFTTHDDYK